MEVRLQKWGNSNGIRIPKAFVEALNLKTNDKVNLIQEDNRIIITASRKTKISLAERFQKYNGKNLSKDFNWDESVGKEIW